MTRIVILSLALGIRCQPGRLRYSLANSLLLRLLAVIGAVAEGCPRGARRGSKRH
jgi:hypothetical protein